MTLDEKLGRSLKLRFRLAPAEPTTQQLSRIKAAISDVIASGRLPTDNDWYRAVAANCSSTGKYVYGGVDNSDLNTLLALALQTVRGQK
ncbi:hypothetical protein [Burkholderia cepacia]|uniref:hypothetical protein n=1 Tax=Burkholderia cepacia TaxID=292 RepID=UPI00158906F6|nr:hypothetical protein [Burkholderia cepacia]